VVVVAAATLPVAEAIAVVAATAAEDVKLTY
jgi:hypothetical protein